MNTGMFYARARTWGSKEITRGSIVPIEVCRSKRAAGAEAPSNSLLQGTQGLKA